MVSVKKCCFVVDLRIAGIVLALIQIFASLAYMMHYDYPDIKVCEIDDDDDDDLIPNVNGTIFNITATNSDASESSEPGCVPNSKSETYMAWADIAILLLLDLFALIMIYGAIARNKKFAVPWIVCASVYGVCCALNFLFTAYRILLPELGMNFGKICLILYFWINIYSMYKMFKVEEYAKAKEARSRKTTDVEDGQNGSGMARSTAV